ncbi:MAG: hypothetical protein KAJ12_11795, partial [Bacteroidetes bacterium]|nr:hypothetical protein [Bacteroidota bacterium]
MACFFLFAESSPGTRPGPRMDEGSDQPFEDFLATVSAMEDSLQKNLHIEEFVAQSGRRGRP